MVKILGFEIRRSNTEIEEKLETLAPPIKDDGAVVVAAGGSFGTYVDLDGTVRTEAELISKYRELSMQPEIEAAISDISNEVIIQEDDQDIVRLDLEDAQLPDEIKKIILTEFNNILELLEFNQYAYDIFMRYYIDGRLYYHVLFDKEKSLEGIKELRYLDPRKIRKIREVTKKKIKNMNVAGTESVTKVKNEYFIYNERGYARANNNPLAQPGSTVQGIRIAKDAILHITSGLTDAAGTLVLSHLHKAIKPMNQLRALEDATIIYRICVVEDTRVKTPSGYKYIKDIQPNDEVFVFTLHGLETAKVKKQWSNGNKKVYKVSTQHHQIKGTDNHPILVMDKETNIVSYIPISKLIPKQHNVIFELPKEKEDTLVPLKAGRTQVLKLLNSNIWVDCDIANKEIYIKNLTEKYPSISSSSIRNFLYGQQYLNQDIAIEILEQINLLNKAEFDQKYEGIRNDVNIPNYVTPEFAKLFGFLIGDGSVDDNRITFAEGTDKNQNEYYASLLKEFFGNCNRYSTKNREYCNWTTNNTLAAELFKDLGFVTGSKNKRIPLWVFQSSKEIKKSFIEGLADADGHIKINDLKDRWTAEIELSNKQLIEDIKEVWTSIGLSSGHIRHRIHEQETRKFGNEIRTIPQTESWAVYLSNIPLKKFEPILSIEEGGFEEVFDIEVDHEKHNFIGNGIVLHNSRAPERRIFYIDVGNLPKMKAEQYLRDMMTKYKNKLVYDNQTGEIRDDRKFISMLEDFWLPRREGGKGTEITTLPAGQNLGELSDVNYFQQKLYKSLNVPFSRMEPESAYTLGRATEISRDEVKFAKFIDRLRLRFSLLFLGILERQLVLKNIIIPDEWDDIKNKIKFRWARDNLFAELKEAEIMTDRLNRLNMIMPFIGRYYSNEWVRRNLLKQDDEDMIEIDDQIDVEKTNPQYAPPVDPMNPMGGGMGQMYPDQMGGGMGQMNGAMPPQEQPQAFDNGEEQQDGKDNGKNPKRTFN